MAGTSWISSLSDFFKNNATGIGGIGELLGGAGGLYSGITNANIAKKQFSLGKQLANAELEKQDQFAENYQSAFSNLYGG